MTRIAEDEARIATAMREAAWLRQHGAEVSYFASRADFGERYCLERIAKIGNELRTYARRALAALPRDSA